MSIVVCFFRGKRGERTEEERKLGLTGIPSVSGSSGSDGGCSENLESESSGMGVWGAPCV